MQQSIKSKIIDYKEGMKITKPCIIRGMPNEVYHSSIGLSTSGLKMLLDCPAKYFYKYLSGEYEAKEKPHFKIGKACHCYILEGQKEFERIYWHNPYAKMTKEDLNNELVKMGYTVFKTATKDKLMQEILELNGITQKEVELDSNELNQVIGVSRAINNNKYAKSAFSQDGESELSLFWQDEESDLWLKCRPDFLPYDCKLVPDYKTCQSANPNTFYGDFIKYGYHVQAAQYRTGIKSVTGIDVESFFFVAQEKEPPFITQVYLPDMHIVDYGVKAVKKALSLYQECQQKGFWDTYSDGIITMSLDLKPDDVLGNYDASENIAYAPYWVDKELTKY